MFQTTRSCGPISQNKQKPPGPCSTFLHQHLLRKLDMAMVVIHNCPRRYTIDLLLVYCLFVSVDNHGFHVLFLEEIHIWIQPRYQIVHEHIFAIVIIMQISFQSTNLMTIPWIWHQWPSHGGHVFSRTSRPSLWLPERFAQLSALRAGADQMKVLMVMKPGFNRC